MRLRSVWISQYKNLRDFSIAFDGDGFIDIFVGKNGSGKSNFLEALIEVFDHVFSPRPGEKGPTFEYDVTYELAGRETRLAWREGEFTINDDGRRRVLGQTPVPDHLLVYYSGQNEQVSRLVARYEEGFRGDLRSAQGPTAPRIIGMGPACKKLLIVTILMLPESSHTRQILCEKLGVIGCTRTIELFLGRPYYVQRTEHDPIDDAQRFWSVAGYARTFLDQVVGSIEGEFSPGDLYDRATGQYRLKFSIDRLREAVRDQSGLTLFQSLDALRVLGMLVDVRLPVSIRDFQVSELNLFSDGQLQSIYLFGVAELFKELNCVVLLDEPDAFLHPEWQFEFIKQIDAISDQAARTNHFLLSTHSASTIAADTASRIRLFEVGQAGVKADAKEKADLVRTLSAGLITFSEKEAGLNIEQLIANTAGPVLFTEGVTDAEIVKTAWDKIFPGRHRPFDIVQCFDCGHLRKQMAREELYQANPGRTFFALFDFDKAYGDWAAVGGVKAAMVAAGKLEEPTVERGLVCKRANQPGYAMLLPVPTGLSVRHQVCNAATGKTYGDESRLTIELLFKDVAGLEDYFEVDPDHPANWIRFVGGKVAFAQLVIPGLASGHFEAFRPTFEFILRKIEQPQLA